ncbi:MAG: hypothetical protein V2A54_03500, partial [Bacteroidota bacterium]
MKTTQLNRHRMYDTVLAIFDQNPAIAALIIALTNAIQAFRLKVSEIKQVEKLQGIDLTGFTLDKNKHKEHTAKTAFKISSALQAYCDAIENFQLITSIQFSRYELEKMNDEVFAETCNLIYERATENIVQLNAYGVDPVLLANFSNQIAAFTQSFSQANAARATHKTNTRLLKKLYSEASHILRFQIDKLAVLTDDADANFITLYKNSRVIYDYRGHTANPDPLAPSGFVQLVILDESTGEPIEFVQVEDATSGVKVETDPDGEADYEALPVGSH